MKKILLLLLFFIPISFFAQSNLIEKAISLYSKKEYKQSQEIFQKLLKSQPNNSVVIEYLGDIAGQQKDWDVAIQYYQQLKSSNPTVARFHYKYGGAKGMKAKESSKFKALAMISDIENSFLKAAQLDKNFIDVRYALIELYLELPAIVGGSEKKAQKYAAELLKISPVDGYLAKGRIDMYFKRYSVAEQHFIRAHEIGNSTTTYSKLLDLYQNYLKDKNKVLQLQTTPK